MSDTPQSTRTEILEERGNRDAFRLAVLLWFSLTSILVLLLALLILIASNSSFLGMSLPKPPIAKPAAAPAPAAQRVLLWRGSSSAEVSADTSATPPYIFQVTRPQLAKKETVIFTTHAEVGRWPGNIFRGPDSAAFGHSETSARGGSARGANAGPAWAL